MVNGTSSQKKNRLIEGGGGKEKTKPTTYDHIDGPRKHLLSGNLEGLVLLRWVSEEEKNAS